MVEDRITDSKRIAELLASELSGLSAGILNDVTITDADRDVTPGADGPLAYRITYDGDVVASVRLYPGRVDVVFANLAADTIRRERVQREHGASAGLTLDATTDDTLLVRVGDGASVKAAVDFLREALGE